MPVLIALKGKAEPVRITLGSAYVEDTNTGKLLVKDEDGKTVGEFWQGEVTGSWIEPPPPPPAVG
ncbi:MAG: hypothetical protein AAB654_14705 [Acidobacteriota bacterium]